MRVVVIGGTFNPVHLGHLYLADEVRLSCRYDRVLFIPSNIPAHKEPAEETTSKERIDMLEAALRPYGFFAIDRCEIDRGGISYTIETVRELKQRYDLTGKLGFVIGDDLIEGFGHWKEATALAEEVDLIIAHRTDGSRKPFGFRHRYLDNLLLPISSSDIRRRIMEGRAAQFLLPPPVWRYVVQGGLYRAGGRRSEEAHRR